ncbi:MAG: phage tail protein [Nautiliaceae bacterium]
MILCKLGDFAFTEKEVDNITEIENYPFAEIKRVANNPLYQDIQKENQEFEIKGWYLLKSNNIFETLKQTAREKKPIRFTTLQGSIKVVITSISIGRKKFIKGGAIKQEFSIKLKRYYE